MRITVRVIPRSKRSELIEESDGTFKARVISAPEQGKANAELLGLFSKRFAVKKSGIRILKGEHAREKVIEIAFPKSGD